MQKENYKAKKDLLGKALNTAKENEKEARELLKSYKADFDEKFDKAMGFVF